MEEKKYLIYRHISPSGKSYIGQTCHYEGRCWHHQNFPVCRYFYNAIQKYGWDAFTHEILDEDLSVDEANEREAFYIVKYDTFVPNGYNLTTGGLNYTRSQETKLLMSTGNVWKGKKRDRELVERTNKNPEKIRKTAEKHRGMKRADIAKQHMSDARKKAIEKNGGAFNKGHKIYFNPLNHDQVIQCLPNVAPIGWVNGNPKRKGTAPYINIHTNQIKWFVKINLPSRDWIPWNANVQGSKK